MTYSSAYAHEGCPYFLPTCAARSLYVLQPVRTTLCQDRSQGLLSARTLEVGGSVAYSAAELLGATR
jgi:hypothetical protein